VKLTLPLFFLLAALVCFVVALLIAVSVFGGPFDAWLAGGFVSFTCAFLFAPHPVGPAVPPQ